MDKISVKARMNSYFEDVNSIQFLYAKAIGSNQKSYVKVKRRIFACRNIDSYIAYDSVEGSENIRIFFLKICNSGF